MILFMVFKTMIVMISFLLIGYFLLNLKENILIWGCFYIAFAAISCAKGNIGQRKRIFIYFTVTIIISLWIASIVYPFKTISIGLIIIYCTGAFWVRKFGDEFTYFPVYSALIFMISVIQLPIRTAEFQTLSEALILSAIIFYIAILLWWPWDTPKQLKNLISTYIDQLYIYSKEHFINHSVLTIDPINEFSMSINKINDKGENWIANKNTQKHWHHVCSEINILIKSVDSLTNNIKKIPHSCQLANIHRTLKYTLLVIKYSNISPDSKKSEYYINKSNIKIQKIQTNLLKSKKRNNQIHEITALHEIIFSLKRIIFITKLVQYHVKKL